MIDRARNLAPSLPSWLPFAIVCLIGWGLWGIVQKPLTDRIEVWSIAFLQSGTTLALGLLSALQRRQPLNPRQQGLHFAAGAGVLSYVGTLAFLSAIGEGTTAVVVPLTAMYPVVTILLSVLVAGERLTHSHKAGIVMAMAAIFFLSR